jgi:hypothetical protein
MMVPVTLSPEETFILVRLFIDKETDTLWNVNYRVVSAP